MLTVRNARPLIISTELSSSFKSDEKANSFVFYPSEKAMFLEGKMNTEIHNASEENVKVILELNALGTLYVHLTCPKQMEQYWTSITSTRILV